jgi:hypothetical protein
VRTLIRLARARPLALVAVGVAAVLTIAVVVGLLSSINTGGPEDVASSFESSATPTPTGTPRPTPTPTPTPTDTVIADPETPESTAPTAPDPSAESPLIEPGVIGMSAGPTEGCGEFPSGQTQYLSFSYVANDGNSVDISYAYTDADVQATSGFVLLGSGLPSSGTVSIPRTCPTDATGVFPLITVRVVASTAQGSATAYYSGI